MIAIASDHAGFPLKEEIKKFLEEKNIEFIDCGAHSTDSVDYAKFAQIACLKVTEGYADKAILCCGTGIGISYNVVKPLLLVLKMNIKPRLLITLRIYLTAT